MITGLGIIWSAFLLPHLRHRGSPTSSIEEFERRMDLLAETNRAPRGRWVLTPRSGERFLGPRDRSRSRLLRRRRQVLTFLAEAALFTLIIGLFPPFHAMLIGTGIVAAMLAGYTVLLVRLRVAEVEHARALRVLRRRAEEEAEAARYRSARAVRARPVAANGNGYAASNGRVQPVNGSALPVPYPADDGFDGDVHVIIDEDVHVIVHRSDEIDLRELRTAAR
jgi:hypothetical protein